MAGGTGQAYAVAQTTIGLALETVKGTPVTPQYWVPVKGPKYKPDLTMIPDDTLQGSMVSVYNMVRGLRYDSHGWDSFPYLDSSFPLLVAGELGSPDTVTAAPAATTLATAAAADSSTISTEASIAVGSYIVIGSGATLETHKTTGVSGTAAPYTVTLLTPLVYAQASGAAVTPLTQHTFSLLNNAGQGNQPPSLTITDYDGDLWRQIAAGQMDELTMKGNATGLVDYTTTLMGNPASFISAPSSSFSNDQAAPGWTFTAMLGGTQVATVIDWEIDLKRGTKPIPALTGTEEYFEYFAGPIEPTGKLTFVEQTNSPYIAQYLSGAKEELEIDLYDLSTGAVMDIRSTNCLFKTAELDRSKEWVEVSVEFEMLPSAADATAGGVSPLQITVANTVTAAYS